MKYISIGIASFLLIIILGGCVNASGTSELARFSECPDSPNCVSSLADPNDEEHYIEPFIFDIELSAAFENLESYLSTLSNVEIVVSEKDRYVHAVFKSKVFRFKDDVEFAFRNAGDGSVIVDIQSRSRLGYSDMGVNRSRMEEIRKVLQAEAE